LFSSYFSGSFTFSQISKHTAKGKPSEIDGVEFLQDKSPLCCRQQYQSTVPGMGSRTCFA